jgi:hypothetical protein
MQARLGACLFACLQKRASNPLLSDEDLSRQFAEHTAGLAKAAAAAISAALEHTLLPLLPAPLSALAAASKAAAPKAGSSSSSSSVVGPGVVAAAEAWRRSGSGRQLSDVFRRFEAVNALMNEGGDERWSKQPEDIKLAAWRTWVDEVVWGRPPVASSTAAAGVGSRRDAAAAGGVQLPPPPQQQQQDGGYGYRGSREEGYGSRGASSRGGDGYGSRGDRDRDRERDGRDRDGRDSRRRSPDRDGGYVRSSGARGGSRYEQQADERDRKRPRA